MQLVDLQISRGFTQVIKQEKVYTPLAELKFTHIDFAILNSDVTVIYLRFIKNTYFYVVKQKKVAIFGFF